MYTRAVQKKMQHMFLWKWLGRENPNTSTDMQMHEQRLVTIDELPSSVEKGDDDDCCYYLTKQFSTLN